MTSEGIKAPVRATATTNITLAGQQTVATVALVAGDRCLVAGQTDAAENGIYVVTTGDWVRANDFNQADDLLSGMLVLDTSTSLLNRAIFTGTYNPGTTSITFDSIGSLASTLINKTISAATNTIITEASGNLAATELNAALAELDADITATDAYATAVDADKIGAAGVTYENLNVNGDVGFGATQVPRGDLVVPLSQIGVTAGDLVQVNQALTATTRADPTVLGTSLNHTLSDTGVKIQAFNGVAGVTYHCRTLGTGTLAYVAGVIETPGSASISTATDDTFDVEMITATTCRIKNYHKGNGNSVIAFDGPIVRPFTVAVTSLIGGEFTKINFAAALPDPTSAFDDATDRVTPQVAGYYVITGSIECASSSYDIDLQIRKNDVTVATSGVIGTANLVTVADIIYMNGVDDYLELWGYSSVTQDTVVSSQGTYLTVSMAGQ
jgi:hypothetical protein